jgi:hypothetical protein
MDNKVDQSFLSFIKNPQGEGVWSLNIDFNDTGVKEIKSLLNLDFDYYRPFRFKSRFNDRSEDPVTIPFLFPKLFAYIRTCLPDKIRRDLMSLLHRSTDSDLKFRSRYTHSYRMYHVFDEVSTSPARLSPAKKRKLKNATDIFMKHFVHFRFEPVPEDISKINFIDRRSTSFFQVTEEIPGQIKIMTPCHSTILLVESFISSLPISGYSKKIVKFFSPETSLMQIYLPLLKMIPLTNIVRDKTFVKNLSLALNEISEQRYQHSVRAIGIATEEILVEIFETCIRERAPEAPLGSLISLLNEKITKISQGDKDKSEMLRGAPFKEIGNIIESIKEHNDSDNSLLSTLEILQKNVLPSFVAMKRDVDCLLADKPSIQRISLFPKLIQDSLADIVPLRNRVSHRVDKRFTPPDVGYIEAAIALKSLLMIGIWWYKEKVQIDYTKDIKEIISQTISRSSKT